MRADDLSLHAALDRDGLRVIKEPDTRERRAFNATKLSRDDYFRTGPLDFAQSVRHSFHRPTAEETSSMTFDPPVEDFD